MERMTERKGREGRQGMEMGSDCSLDICLEEYW